MATRRTKRLTPILMLAALLPMRFAAGQTAASATAVSAVAPAPTVFYACYIPIIGTVYRIKQPGLPNQCFFSSHVQFSWTDGAGSGVTAHAALTGLLNDDHPQYLLTSGLRALTGNLSAGGFKLTGLGAATALGEAVRYEQAVKSGDAASGDLSGAFPNPNVAKLQGSAVAATTPTMGQVLTYNGTAWAPAASSSGGVTDHGALTGLTDDDHPQYLLANAVRPTTNGFAVTGVFASGAIPVTGAGVRMMWYPAKAAFRAGYADAQWDDANVGIYSTALGAAVTASGYGSTAFGNTTTASGVNSTALGFLTTASGLTSVATGYATTASGIYSMATGENTIASGNSAIATGIHTTASGHNSTAMGLETTASGANSTALGSRASTDGRTGSFVYGDLSISTFVSQANNEFAVRASGGVRFRTVSDLSAGCDLPAGSGVWACTSSRLTKANFRSLDSEAVLGKLAGLSIQEWSYKTERGVRHVGPTAEDFHAAFGLGPDSKSIGMIDESGISLLAIQALEARTTELKRENELLKRENAEFRAALTRLESLIQSRSGSR